MRGTSTLIFLIFLLGERAARGPTYRLILSFIQEVTTSITLKRLKREGAPGQPGRTIKSYGGPQVLPNIVGGLIPCRFTAVIGSASGARGSKEPGSHPKLNVPLVALLTFLGSVEIN